MNRWHPAPDVAHVRTSDHAVRDHPGRQQPPPEPPGVTGVRLGERAVRNQFGVVRRGPVNRTPGSGSSRPAPRAGEHALFESAQPQLVRCAEQPAPDGAVRDNVDGLPAGDDDAGHAITRGQVLAQHRYPEVAQHQGVERVHAALREQARVRRAAAQLNPQLGRGEQAWVGRLVRVRVHHHRGVDAAQRTTPGKQLLARAALLGGRAEHREPATQARHERRERQARPQACCRDDVVTAGVPEPGQGVVLAAEEDVRAWPPASPRRERGLKAIRRVLDAEARRGESLRQDACGIRFTEGQLGPGVDPVRDREELPSVLLHGPLDAGLHLRGP